MWLRAEGKCQRCAKDLNATWHQAHLLPWSRGGATDPSNMQAWCADCNLSVGATDVSAALSRPLRPWQQDALKIVMPRLFQNGRATVHAAPGAGKTVFAGTVARQLLGAGLVERVVVVVPNAALVRQWTDGLSADLNLHLDSDPRDNVFEHPQTMGCVLTYQALVVGNTAVSHAQIAQSKPTLVIFDEVHHIGEEASWGDRAADMVGRPAQGQGHAGMVVLNLTGTLFRSSKQRRIGTVEYIQDPEVPDKWRAVADYTRETRELIGDVLRPVNLFTMSADAHVINVREHTVTAAPIADLSREERNAAVRDLGASQQWVDSFALAAIRALKNQQDAIPAGGPRLKLLYVASSIKAAQKAADTLNRIAQFNFARLIVSTEPGAVNLLRSAAKDPSTLAIVAVQMVTEGFDCPEIGTIAYAHNRTAPLFVAQTVARAMRVSAFERERQMVLPAQVLIPDHPELKRSFLQALAGALVHELKSYDDGQVAGVNTAGDGSGDGAREYRFHLVELSSAVLTGATVANEADGEVAAQELLDFEVALNRVHVPAVYAPQVAVAARQVRATFPRIYSEPTLPVERSAPRTTRANPRDVNHALREAITTRAKWMAQHLEHDTRYHNPGVFQGKANDAAGIPKGARQDATPEQLQLVLAWMTSRAREHVGEYGCAAPAWLGEEA
jgi:superfamily II DNA or RNA helicase